MTLPSVAEAVFPQISSCASLQFLVSLAVRLGPCVLFRPMDYELEVTRVTPELKLLKPMCLPAQQPRDHVYQVASRQDGEGRATCAGLYVSEK